MSDDQTPLAGCSNHGCQLRVGLTRGMGTNGPCHCADEIRRALEGYGYEPEWARATERAIGRLARLAEENRDKRDDPAFITVRRSELTYVLAMIEQARAVASFKDTKARLLALLRRMLAPT